MANAGEILIQAELDIVNLVNNSKRLDKEMDSINSSANTAQGGFEKLETQVTKTAQAVKSAASSMGSTRATIQGIGYQLQDIAVQAEMGTSAIRILGQQGPQVLSLFGPLGAVAGAVVAISSAMAGALLPSLLDSSDATEVLAKAQKNLKEVVTKTESSVSALSEEIIRLSKISEDAAKAKIAVAMSEAKIAIKAAGDSSQQAFEQFDSLFGSFTNSGRSIQNAVDELKRYEAKGKDVAAVINELGGTYGGAIAEVNSLNAVTHEMSKTLGITQTEALGLIKLLAQLEKDRSPANIKLLAIALSDLSNKNGWTNETLNKLTNTLNNNSLSALDAEASIKILESALKDLQTTVNNSRGVLDGNVAKLNQLAEIAERHAATIGKTEREVAKYNATLLATTDESKKELDSTLKRIDASYDIIESYEAQQKALKEKEQADKKAQREAEQSAKKAQREAEQAAKKEASEQKKTKERLRALAEEYRKVAEAQNGYGRAAAINIHALKLGTNATEEQKRQAQELAGAIYDVGTAMANMNELAGNLSPTFKVDMDFAKNSATINDAVTGYQNQIARINSQISTIQSSPMSVNKEKQLQDLEQAKVIYAQAITEAEQMRGQIEEQYRKQRIEAQWEEWKQASDAAQIFGNAVDAVMNSASSSISGLLMGAQSLKDSLLGISNTIVNSVIQSIIEMGMAQVKSMIMGKAASAAVTSSSIAQAAMISKAWVPAAALASLATNGANAVPAQAGIAATMTTAQTMAITPRKLGGAVSANKMYRVGENNQPELYKASNGMQYMIPGSSGRVFSNKDSMSKDSGGGGSVSVVINQTNHFGDKESRGDDQQLAKGLAKAIEATVKQQLTAQMRPGGMLSGR